MTEPEIESSKPEESSTLGDMLEKFRSGAVSLARYRVGSQVEKAEAPKIEECEVKAREIVDLLRQMITARTNAASAGS